MERRLSRAELLALLGTAVVVADSPFLQKWVWQPLFGWVTGVLSSRFTGLRWQTDKWVSGDWLDVVAMLLGLVFYGFFLVFGRVKSPWRSERLKLSLVLYSFLALMIAFLAFHLWKWQPEWIVQESATPYGIAPPPRISPRRWWQSE